MQARPWKKLPNQGSIVIYPHLGIWTAGATVAETRRSKVNKNKDKQTNKLYIYIYIYVECRRDRGRNSKTRGL